MRRKCVKVNRSIYMHRWQLGKARRPIVESLTVGKKSIGDREAKSLSRRNVSGSGKLPNKYQTIGMYVMAVNKGGSFSKGFKDKMHSYLLLVITRHAVSRYLTCNQQPCYSAQQFFTSPNNSCPALAWYEPTCLINVINGMFSTKVYGTKYFRCETQWTAVLSLAIYSP